MVGCWAGSLQLVWPINKKNRKGPGTRTEIHVPQKERAQGWWLVGEARCCQRKHKGFDDKQRQRTACKSFWFLTLIRLKLERDSKTPMRALRLHEGMMSAAHWAQEHEIPDSLESKTTLLAWTGGGENPQSAAVRRLLSRPVAARGHSNRKIDCKKMMQAMEWLRERRVKKAEMKHLGESLRIMKNWRSWLPQSAQLKSRRRRRKKKK